MLPAQFPLQKEIKPGPDDSNGAQLPNLLPARRHGRRQNVGSQLKLERQRQITGKSHADLQTAIRATISHMNHSPCGTITI